MYSPKIRDELVMKLYLLKHSLDKKKPMTQLVNEAVEQYLSQTTGGDEDEGNRTGKINNQNSCCSSESS